MHTYHPPNRIGLLRHDDNNRRLEEGKLGNIHKTITGVQDSDVDRDRASSCISGHQDRIPLPGGFLLCDVLEGNLPGRTCCSDFSVLLVHQQKARGDTGAVVRSRDGVRRRLQIRIQSAEALGSGPEHHQGRWRQCSRTIPTERACCKRGLHIPACGLIRQEPSVQDRSDCRDGADNRGETGAVRPHALRHIIGHSCWPHCHCSGMEINGIRIRG